ncbi:MAG TPA: SPFH domain-containing protein [Dyella sp.]|uniref:SPFH domain-containing protein n=1 Tax=Dyella sp. TaxID=1869338 RepID=UPI002CE8F58A|nr:SPFH domain-containing protein [Dyella sp.]HTV85255.1 SPFH domain-containing protein [Dyella sp.]
MIMLIAIAATVVVLVALIFASRAIIYIPNDRVGIVERLWGAPSLTRGLIALDGEVGYQPQVMRGGIHLFFPFQFRVHKVDLVTIPQGEIGYVFARDGRELVDGQTLGEIVDAGIEDASAFLRAGGQKGPQRAIVREGTHAVNVAQFAIITAARVHGLLLSDEEKDTVDRMGQLLRERNGFIPVVIGGKTSTTVQAENADRPDEDAGDVLGVVTIHDGPVLAPDEIVAPRVGEDPADKMRFHNNFQNIDAFLRAGGRRGRQHQVLVEGTYFINRLFATVEFIRKTIVPVGSVGVVVSYFGKAGADRSGEGYSHGELVDNGCRGVWKEPLLPGKYAFNTYAGKVQLVPTTNFILKWSKEVTNAHKFDENLSEVALITKDAFEPLMPLSVVVHIDYRKAPLVVQRFGDIKRLVDQTLDPMVSAYFKNTGQTKTLIELLQERSAIQEKAGVDMKDRFAAYNLELQEVLIGTPHGNTGDASGQRIDTILNQLRDRQVAKEQMETYDQQQQAAVKERTLREAQARTQIQTDLTKSEINVKIKTNEGDAAIAAATKEAQVININAEAERKRQIAVGEGKAAATESVGKAEANAIRAKADALTGEGARMQLINDLGRQFADALREGQIAIVPKIALGADGGNALSTLAQLANAFMAEKLDPAAWEDAAKAPVADRTDRA